MRPLLKLLSNISKDLEKLDHKNGSSKKSETLELWVSNSKVNKINSKSVLELLEIINFLKLTKMSTKCSDKRWLLISMTQSLSKSILDYFVSLINLEFSSVQRITGKAKKTPSKKLLTMTLLMKLQNLQKSFKIKSIAQNVKLQIKSLTCHQGTP